MHPFAPVKSAGTINPIQSASRGLWTAGALLRATVVDAAQSGRVHLQIGRHAVEARLYAEDVPKGFLPATGRLAHLAFPDDVRADSGVRTGDAISRRPGGRRWRPLARWRGVN